MESPSNCAGAAESRTPPACSPRSDSRVTFRESAVLLEMSLGAFKRRYRAFSRDAGEAAEWAHRLDIRESRAPHCGARLTCSRDAVLRLREEIRSTRDGHLAVSPSERAARLGAYAQPGGGRRLALARAASRG